LAALDDEALDDAFSRWAAGSLSLLLLLIFFSMAGAASAGAGAAEVPAVLGADAMAGRAG
jgi:hypothetical protein